MPNDQPCTGLVLVDMGCEYGRGWGSDITTTWPAGGVFSPGERQIYGAVLDALTTVKAAMAPGVSWVAMHELAESVILTHLQKSGYVNPATPIPARVAARTGALFMPHGLGHLLGMATHDVGGYGAGCPPRPTAPGLCRLRTARPLAAGMVITVEPGCYFARSLLEEALAAGHPHLVARRVRAALDAGFGGVRLEDNVVVTDAGVRCLTHVPRSVEDVERVLAGGEWP